MKLNYRDKMVLIVVFVLLIIVAGFMLFIKPALMSVVRQAVIWNQQRYSSASLKIR